MGTHGGGIAGLSLLFIITSLIWTTPASSSITLAYHEDHVIPLSSSVTKFAESVQNGTAGAGIMISTVSTGWTLNGIQLELDDIRLDKEIVVIEENGTSFLSIDKNRKGRAVQIQVTQQTTVFAVQVYGFLDGILKSVLIAQIEGYNPATRAPNGTMFGSYVQLNVSTTPGWYTQTFPSPISLAPGNYFLVIKGYSPSDNSRVYWFNNEVNPQYPALNISDTNDGISWSTGVSGKPLRYKMLQRVAKIYDPQAINMSIGVGNDTYPVLDGASSGKGVLSLTGLNQAVNFTTLVLPVENNNSVSLLFNYSARAFLEKQQDVKTTLTVHSDSENEWEIAFSTNRAAVNFTVEVPIPPSWHDVVVFRNSTNITAQTVMHGYTLVIGNASISDDDQFVVQARSPNIPLTITMPRLAFEPEQQLKCSVLVPASGNVTFEFYDALDLAEFVETRQVPPQNATFAYTFSANADAGTGNVFVIWNNATDAGTKIQAVSISVPLKLDPATLATIGAVSATGVVVVAGSYKFAKHSKHRRQLYEQRVVERCIGMTSLQLFLVIEKRSGLNVYQQSFLGSKVDASLVSGFLEAIRNIGIELSQSKDASQTIKLEFKNFKILMNEYMNFRLVLIMKENPSEQLTGALTKLSYDIGRVFSDALESFKGYTGAFTGIGDLVRTHLNTDFISPLEISPEQKVSLGAKEQDVLNAFKTKIALAGTGRIYVTDILPDRACDFQLAEIVYKLLEKGVLRTAGKAGIAS